jgi:hypothetical protein
MTSHEKLAKVELQATFTLPFADGQSVTVKSDILPLMVTDEYLDISPRIDAKDISTIPV